MVAAQGQAAETTPAATESQREAAAQLKGMAEYLAGLQSFSVMFRAGYDVVQASGQRIEFGETRRLVLARPDRLRLRDRQRRQDRSGPVRRALDNGAGCRGRRLCAGAATGYD